MNNNIKNKGNEAIAIAVVIYGSKLTECNVYKTLIKNNADKIDCLLVFDNSKTTQYEKIEIGNGIYEYFWNPKNPGVSENYNKAANYACQNGFKWVMLLDQDTSFPPEALSIYKESLRQYPDKSLFVPIHKISDNRYLSPANSCLFRHKNEIKPGIYNINKYDIINSGMLVNVNDFIKVGGYNEEVGLDFSDFQFLDRLKTAVKQVVVLNIICIQDFSNNEDDKEKLLNRYKIYCRNASKFETRKLVVKVKITYLVLKHTMALTIRCKSIEPLKILLKSILNK